MAADSSKSGLANSPAKKPLQVLPGPAPTQLPWELTQVPRLSWCYTNQVFWGHHWDCDHNFMLGSPSETFLLPQRLPNARCPDARKYPNTPEFGSVHSRCPNLCDPMNCSMPGFSVHLQLLELAQIHVHQIGDAIQPSHPLSSPSPPAFSLSQHQGLFNESACSHQVAKVLEFQLQHQSFQWTLRTDLL